MYLEFFGLTEAPFSITPDPAFVYLSPVHRDALAHLLYGVGKGGASGFVQLTGEVGTGKTTICRCLLEQVPEDTVIALILNPVLTPRELLATICEELRIDIENIRDSSKAMVDALNAFLLKQHASGRRVVVVIDEAQNLSPEALEQVRLLTNLETSKHKLLQVVLLGQPELRQLLQRQSLRQLAQRITARYHLVPLSEKETMAYVRHRMQVAGARQNPFSRSAMRALYQRSGGVPRLVNIIADRALAGAYAREVSTVGSRLVHAAANEVQPSESRVRRSLGPAAIGLAASLALLVISVAMWGIPSPSGPTPEVQPDSGFRESKEGARLVASDSRQVRVLPESPADSVVSPIPSEILQTAQPASADATKNPDMPRSSGSPGTAATEQTSVASVPLSEAGTTGAPGLAWLEEQHGLSWWGLAELWQDPGSAAAIQAACDGQLGTGYACLREQGSWARIRKLGLPMLLILHDNGSHRVLLRGLDEGKVVLGAGSEPLKFDRDAIDPLWLGDYIVAWPQARDWPLEIKRGESGAAVEIVMTMASKATPAWTGGKEFDASFESWLIAFQRQHGLDADGIIGPRTLLYLMAPTISEPRLVIPGDEGS